MSKDPLYVTLNGPNSRYVAMLDNNAVPMFFRREDERVFDFKWHAATSERSYGVFVGARNQWGRRNTEQIVLDENFSEIEQNNYSRSEPYRPT